MSNHSIIKFKSLLIVLLSFIVIQLNAQNLPTDMRNIKSSDITDAQLIEFVQKAASSGLTEAQIVQEFSRRGMPTSEIENLKNRITALSSTKPPVNSAPISSDRTVAKPTNATSASNVNAIFGSELFSTPNLSFEPDLRIPTPKNYTLGPDDKLLLDVFGVNLSQQELKVSAEGTVYIKYAGPVQVNGLTVEEASQIINRKLVKYYPALASGQTKAILTLTGIRTIRIMVLGASKKPGTYNLTSLATLFNALYVSGGPMNDGSFRNIELIRNSKTIVKADLYDFLLNGSQKSNVRLMDNDIIKIPFAKTKITLQGAVNREGIYEILSNENLQTAIDFAGGFKTNAYKARITGTRVTDFDKQIIDVEKDRFQGFALQDGDVFTISSIIDKYQNKVTIEGAIYKPGSFSLTPNLTVGELIKKAEGFREDVYVGRAIIIRRKDDLTKEYINLNLNSAESKNFILKKDDEVKISSIFDLRDQKTVIINGAVRNGGVFNWEENLSLKSLILQAGGFAENATGKGIEISRRKKDVDVTNPNSPIVEIIKVDDDKDLSKTSADVLLQPFDIINIKVDAAYKTQISVSINGEVLNPGSYSLISRVERISDLVKRAGGTIFTADINGAKLIRRNAIDYYNVEKIQKIANASAKDSSNVILEEEMKAIREVAINLEQIMKNPGGKDDIYLEEGDIITIPLKNNLVVVSGEVFKPVAIAYEQNKTLKQYLNDAGGVTRSGNKKRIFVVYPNGKAAKVKTPFLFFRKYPAITAGSKIYIPKDPEKKGFDYAKTGFIISGLSALITAAVLTYQVTK